MALGTLSLEGTDLAVTAEQAAELLPLWKAVDSLSTSDTVTTVEMNAVYQQIQGIMTDEQLDAIQSMDLTSQDMTELANQYGVILIEAGSMAPTSEQPVILETNPSYGQPIEGFPVEAVSGGDPGGMAPPIDSAPPDAGTQSSTQVTSQSSSQGSPGGSSILYQAVVDLLKELVAA